MKKLLLGIISAVFLFSCEKKEIKPETTEPAPEPVKVEETIAYKPVFVQSQALQQVNLEQLGNIVGAHDNDTIYVNNFFATWCGPCMKEIPHFTKKMKAVKGQPIKFTFISLDDPAYWNTAVKDFANEHQLADNIVLVNGQELTPQFFSENFEQWDGGSIPFTSIKKGSQHSEILGSTSYEVLEEKIKSLQ